MGVAMCAHDKPAALHAFLDLSQRYLLKAELKADERGRVLIAWPPTSPTLVQQKAPTMPKHTDPMRNHLLSALPQADWMRWHAHLEWMPMSLGQVLVNAGQSVRQVYFPTTAIVSQMYTTSEGRDCELAVIGREGMVGVSVLMGADESSPYEAAITHAGEGFRMKKEFVIDEVQRGSASLHLLLRYTQSQITQVSQQVACNRYHSLEQRLCFWLLNRLDRLDGQELVATHERIASMLGVRREGITAATLKLQSEDVIRCSRGHITVLDRHSLERQACECYPIVKDELARLVWPLNEDQLNQAADRRRAHARGHTSLVSTVIR